MKSPLSATVAVAANAEALPSTSATITYHRTRVDGLDIFYREGGPSDAPTLVLLHGFPAASHQYARLMDWLSDRVHVIALDYPGFGYSASPASSNDGGDFTYTFDHLADVTEAFLTALGVNRYLDDLPDAELHLLDTGHFALDEQADTIAELVADFIARNSR